MSTSSDPRILAQNLTKRYDRFTAVDQLNLQLEEGEIFGLLGPNGAGKTTTILMLLGLSEPTSGLARVLGMDPTRKPLEIKRRVGYVPDNVGFYADMTGIDNLTYTARLNGIKDSSSRQHIATLLEQVGLSGAAHSKVGTYSRGMRQRLGIADALVKEPEVLILDEPTIGIDPEGMREILELIRNLRDERQVTVLLSSHLLHQVQSICDRVGIFVRGKMIAEGPVQQLSAQLSGNRTTLELAVDDWHKTGEILKSIGAIESIEREKNYWVIKASSDIRSELARGLANNSITILHLRQIEEVLDEIYSRYFEGIGSGAGNSVS